MNKNIPSGPYDLSYGDSFRVLSGLHPASRHCEVYVLLGSCPPSFQGPWFAFVGRRQPVLVNSVGRGYLRSSGGSWFS